MTVGGQGLAKEIQQTSLALIDVLVAHVIGHYLLQPDPHIMTLMNGINCRLC